MLSVCIVRYKSLTSAGLSRGGVAGVESSKPRQALEPLRNLENPNYFGQVYHDFQGFGIGS